MSLESAKIFLCIVISLTTCVCQYTESHRPELVKSKNVTYIYPDVVIDTYDGVETKIAGGTYANVGDFPYMAVVHQLLGNVLVGKCGGSILSKRWVLTAAHCVERYPRRFFVVFGIVDKSGIQYDYLEGPGVSMITTEAFSHPQYAEDYNDIGLLHMPQDIPFSSTVQPIKLAYTTENFVNKNAYVIGWGKDHITNSGTVRLKYVTLPIIENNVCKQFWAISGTHICTAAGLGRDACQGDSGGPLVIRQNDRDLQVGIVSYGDGFCPSNSPGVFTRVSSFIDWIYLVTKVLY